MGFFDALSRGLERSREALNEVFYFGGEVDEDFWEDLEDTLVTVSYTHLTLPTN